MTQLMENALMGTVLILVTAVLRRALKGRLPAGTWLVLWGVCLFRLLTPASPDSILSIYRLPRLPAGTGQTAAPIAAAAGRPVLPAGAAAQPVAVNYLILPINAAGQLETEAPAGFTMPSLSTVLWGIYLLCAAVLALYFAWVWLSTRRAVGRTILLDRGDPRYAALPRGVRLREGPMDGAPLTFGAVRPTVVLSPGLSQTECACALAHEAVHARRRDNLWHYAMAAALVVHWWNPAVWLMYRLLRRDVELACDRAVLAKLGGEHRADYASALISLSTQAEGPAFCRPFGQKQAEERIVAIMKYKKTTIAGLVLALALVFSVTAAFAASAPEEAPEPDNAITADAPENAADPADVPEAPADSVPEPEDTLSDAEEAPEPGDPNPNAKIELTQAGLLSEVYPDAWHYFTAEEYAQHMELFFLCLSEHPSYFDYDYYYQWAELTLEAIRSGVVDLPVPDFTSGETIDLALLGDAETCKMPTDSTTTFIEGMVGINTAPILTENQLPGTFDYHDATPEEYEQLIELYKDKLNSLVNDGLSQETADSELAAAEYTLELLRAGDITVSIRDHYLDEFCGMVLYRPEGCFAD